MKFFPKCFGKNRFQETCLGTADPQLVGWIGWVKQPLFQAAHTAQRLNKCLKHSLKYNVVFLCYDIRWPLFSYLQSFKQRYSYSVTF